MPTTSHAGNVPLAPLVVVAGPTASGKSTLALELALRFHGEIVNCDSVQLYCGLDIGAAKVPPGERRGVPHHLIDVLDPTELATAGDYAARARPVLRAISASGALPIVVGGTGFYLRALLDGLADGPARDETLRQRLTKLEAGRAGRLHRLLRRLDRETARRIHARDVNKLVRALEICILSRRPATEVFQRGSVALEGYRTLKLVLRPDRKALHERIAARTRQMFAAGLVEEVRALLAAGVPEDAKPFESIGYRETLEVLRGHLSLEQAIEATTIATRQYAKRQDTWFRRETDALAVQGFGDDPSAIAELTQITAHFLQTLQAVLLPDASQYR